MSKQPSEQRVSAAERASETSSADQANELIVRANERADKRLPSTYFSISGSSRPLCNDDDDDKTNVRPRDCFQVTSF